MDDQWLDEDALPLDGPIGMWRRGRLERRRSAPTLCEVAALARAADRSDGARSSCPCVVVGDLVARSSEGPMS